MCSYEIDGVKCEPFERVQIDTPEEYQGSIIQALSERKGDMLEPNEKGLLVLNVQDKFSSRFVAVDEDTANELVEKGYLLEMKSSNNDTRLEAIKDFCDTMLQKYDSDLDEVLSKYNEGLIPTCVKVEAETVYYNMTKLLDKIKELAK